jgi:hypothetical protein
MRGTDPRARSHHGSGGQVWPAGGTQPSADKTPVTRIVEAAEALPFETGVCFGIGTGVGEGV